MNPIHILPISDVSDPFRTDRSRAFEAIYTECFPDPDERETIGQWLERLATPDVAPPRSRTYVLAAIERGP